MLILQILISLIAVLGGPLSVEAQEPTLDLLPPIEAPYNQIQESTIETSHNNNNKEFLLSYTDLSQDQIDVATYIYEKSIDMGLDYDTTLQIAWCESQFIEYAKNPKSSATGVYQFINGTWQYYGEKIWGDEFSNRNRLNYQDNVDLALEIISQTGISDWTASASCHQKA